MKKNILVLLVLTQLANGLIAQNRSPFDSLVSLLEKNHSLVFYYDKKQTNPLDVKAINASGSLDDILMKLFEGTDFVFLNDKQGRVFITKGFSLNNALPADYFVKRFKGDKIDTSFNETFGKSVIAKMENIVYAIGVKGGTSTSAVISGYVRDATSGEPLSSATVAVEGGKVVSTDGFGFYSITVPKGRHILKISSMGMKELIRQINVQGNGKLEMEMKEEVRSLKTIVVAQKQSNVR